MTLKRHLAPGLVTAPRSDKEASGTPIVQNAYPRVLGGRPLKQLELPREVLAAARKQRPAATVAAPSNLAEVRAKLMARKPTLG